MFSKRSATRTRQIPDTFAEVELQEENSIPQQHRRRCVSAPAEFHHSNAPSRRKSDGTRCAPLPDSSHIGWKKQIPGISNLLRTKSTSGITHPKRTSQLDESDDRPISPVRSEEELPSLCCTFPEEEVPALRPGADAFKKEPDRESDLTHNLFERTGHVPSQSENRARLCSVHESPNFRWHGMTRSKSASTSRPNCALTGEEEEDSLLAIHALRHILKENGYGYLDGKRSLKLSRSDRADSTGLCRGRSILQKCKCDMCAMAMKALHRTERFKNQDVCEHTLLHTSGRHVKFTDTIFVREYDISSGTLTREKVQDLNVTESIVPLGVLINPHYHVANQEKMRTWLTHAWGADEILNGDSVDGRSKDKI